MSNGKIKKLFAVPLWQAKCPPRLVRSLSNDVSKLREVDHEGRQWSKANYPGGYTSFNSVPQLHRMGGSFAELAELLKVQVEKFSQALGFDSGYPLELTDLWANVMDAGCTHAMHLHPASSLSGTVYIAAPKNCAPLRIENPSFAFQMAEPPRTKSVKPEYGSHIEVPVQVGLVLLWPSYLRHGVAQQVKSQNRVSLSFNFHW